MAKMRKEYDPNKVMRRKRRPIIYIICEGKKTGINNVVCKHLFLYLLCALTVLILLMAFPQIIMLLPNAAAN